MTKAELASRLQERLPMLRQEDCRLLVAEMLEAMSQSLRHGRRIEIRGFGVFSLRHRTARLVLNPRTLERLPVAAKTVPFFRAGKCLQARVLDTPTDCL